MDSDAENDRSEQIAVGQIAGLPGVTYTLSTTVEQNSRGITSAVKAHIDYLSVHESPEVAIAKIKAAHNVLMAAGAVNVAFRKLSLANSLGNDSQEFTDALQQYEQFRQQLRKGAP
jgi:hypothetical protein